MIVNFINNNNNNDIESVDSHKLSVELCFTDNLDYTYKERKMKKVLIAITLLLLITGLTADAQRPSKTHDEYHALQRPADITIDGELDDAEGWEGVFESVTGTDGKPYCGIEFDAAGNFVAWESWQGGTWKGADDHETCFAIVWDDAGVYLAISVTDDEHENAANSGWNGDSAQLMIVPNGMREGGQPHILINFALGNNGNIVNHNEKPQGNPHIQNDQVVVVRNEDENETYYEIRFLPENFGQNSFEEGYEFGLGICINDGDLGAGQNGQKGWSGWYPRAIVHGKNSELTGLVILTDKQLAVEAKNKLTTTWGRLKSIR